MIAVISDSHVPTRSPKIPDEFLERVKKADKTVHCGDFETKEVLEELEEYGEVTAVKGNCDRFELPPSETFKVDGVKFGAYHGTGIHPRGHLPTLVNTAEKLDVEVLLTGHTHQQRAVKEDGKVILNPGSCTGVGGGSSQRGNPRMMEVEVKGGELEAELLELQDGEIKTERKVFQI